MIFGVACEFSGAVGVEPRGEVEKPLIHDVEFVLGEGLRVNKEAGGADEFGEWSEIGDPVGRSGVGSVVAPREIAGGKHPSVFGDEPGAKMQAGAMSVLLVLCEDVRGREAGNVDGEVAKCDGMRAKEFAACVRVGDTALWLDFGREGVGRRLRRCRGCDSGDGRGECARGFSKNARTLRVSDVDASSGILRGKNARGERSAGEREEVATA